MKWNLSESKMIDKLKNISQKGLDKNQLLVLLLLGILLLIIALPTKDFSGEQKIQKNDKNKTENLSDAEDLYTENRYVYQLESRLQKILTQIDGAGKVSVMITLHASAEKVIEKDQNNSEERIVEKDSQGGTRENSQHNLEETTVYTNSETGSPYISKELSPAVEGVVIVSEGGDDPLVIKNITEAVQALFGIDTHKIRVVKGRR